MKVLDVCCGPRGMWFDKKDERALFMDIRSGEYQLTCQKKALEVKPDVFGDFRSLDYKDETFYLVVFDPPHLKRYSESDITKRFGKLSSDWQNDISKGFAECFRVLKKNGVLIFKWSESQYKIGDVLKLTDEKPLFGHKTTKTTHWVTFMKA